MDIESYFNQEFDKPTGTVPMPPQMAEFFAAAGTPEDECVFKCRGLTANDMAMIEERIVEREKQRKKIAEIVAHGTDAEAKTAAIQLLTGLLDEKIHRLFATRIYMVHFGCISPKFSEQAAAKFGLEYSKYFRAVHEKIDELSGKGSSAKKKPSDSGEIQPSEPA